MASTDEETVADIDLDVEKHAGEGVASNKNDVKSSKEAADAETGDTLDENAVDWDGPDDPENPMNWPSWRKTVMVMNIAFITFLSPLASSMTAPCTEYIAHEFHITNDFVAAFTVSGYLLGYVFGPLVVAPLAEIYGRRPLYIGCTLFFLIFTIACAVSSNSAGLIVFRILAGIGGSCPPTIGAASLSDMIPREKRGAVMMAWIMGPLLGPTVGPIAGGYLCQATTWRWAFWAQAIPVGVITGVTVIIMRESYPVVLLERKAKRLQQETGNPNFKSVLDKGRTPGQIIKFASVRPLKMLFMSPIIFLLSIYMAVMYGYLYLLYTTFTQVFQSQYGFSLGSVGLTYIGIGVGCLLGVLAAGLSLDRLANVLTARNGGEYKPEYRLPPLIIGGVLVPAGLFMYGWSSARQEHWIVPIVGTALLGLGLMLDMMAFSVYLVDAFTIYAASATAAGTVSRSLFGAFLPLAGPSLYASLGLDWGNSLLGFIALAMIPIPFVFYLYGERIRNSKLFRVEF